MKHRFYIGRDVRRHMERFDRDQEKTPAEERPETDQTAQEEKKQPPRPETEAAVAPAALEDESQASAQWSPYTIVSRTDVGKVRAANQDAVIECGRLCGVADGMGGHKGGETASAGARDGLVEHLKGKEPELKLLEKAVKAVNRRIFIRAQEDEKLRGMGTTLSVIWLGEKYVYIAHVGDSRIYRMRKGEMQQMTCDHSLVAELLRARVITSEQAAVHPMRNVITRAVGTESGVDVDTMAVEREADDLWLICSDGLSGMVKDDQMAEILRSHPIEEAADLLLQAALDAGGTDNISLVLLKDREGAQ